MRCTPPKLRFLVAGLLTATLSLQSFSVHAMRWGEDVPEAPRGSGVHLQQTERPVSFSMSQLTAPRERTPATVLSDWLQQDSETLSVYLSHELAKEEEVLRLFQGMDEAMLSSHVISTAHGILRAAETEKYAVGAELALQEEAKKALLEEMAPYENMTLGEDEDDSALVVGIFSSLLEQTERVQETIQLCQQRLVQLNALRDIVRGKEALIVPHLQRALDRRMAEALDAVSAWVELPPEEMEARLTRAGGHPTPSDVASAAIDVRTLLENDMQWIPEGLVDRAGLEALGALIDRLLEKAMTLMGGYETPGGPGAYVVNGSGIARPPASSSLSLVWKNPHPEELYGFRAVAEGGLEHLQALRQLTLNMCVAPIPLSFLQEAICGDTLETLRIETIMMSAGYLWPQNLYLPRLRSLTFSLPPLRDDIARGEREMLRHFFDYGTPALPKLEEVVIETPTPLLQLRGYLEAAEYEVLRSSVFLAGPSVQRLIYRSKDPRDLYKSEGQVVLTRAQALARRVGGLREITLEGMQAELFYQKAEELELPTIVLQVFNITAEHAHWLVRQKKAQAAVRNLQESNARRAAAGLSSIEEVYEAARGGV